MKYVVESYLNCIRCPLSRFRRNIVFGRGSIPAEILFIGEAPGKSEDFLGTAFIGPSGKVLDAGIATACRMLGLEKPPRYFISNVLACRPTDEPRGENRAPNAEEAWACWPRLEKTHADVRPRRVVFLGQVAKQFCGTAFPGSVCLPHPAYILRLGGTESAAFLGFARGLADVFEGVLCA
jgi:DNA polymerase